MRGELAPIHFWRSSQNHDLFVLDRLDHLLAGVEDPDIVLADLSCARGNHQVVDLVWDHAEHLGGAVRKRDFTLHVLFGILSGENGDVDDLQRDRYLMEILRRAFGFA